MRAPGLLGALQEDDRVEIPVRVYGDFLPAHLEFREENTYTIGGDDPRTQTSRWFDAESPWRSAALVLPSSLTMETHTGGWKYRVTFAYEELELAQDVEPTDLIVRVRSPCEEFHESGSTSPTATSAACKRHQTLEPE